EYNETDKFFDKYASIETFKRSIQELVDFVFRKIGDDTGALQIYFRFEDSAHALPPSGKHTVEEITLNFDNFPLRLYCLRISENLVVLFNGSEKTSQSALAGKTSMTFTEANQFASKILEALYQKTIYITADEREFRNFDGSVEILL
ncbi:MAG: hypothetical protein WCK03_03500, partial [Candidatus Taylorbacteria bacterium]